MECPHNCHGNGECLSGICHCFPGFLGPDCSRGKRFCLTCSSNCCMIGFPITFIKEVTDHDKDFKYFACFQLLCLG